MSANTQRPRQPPAWVPFAAIAAWFILWFLTPGLLSNGVGSWFTSDGPTIVLIESAVATAVAVAIILLHRRLNRELFARDRLIWAYAPLVSAAIALPFHYELEYPVAIYMLWMTVSVFWQIYLTFGLLQSYLETRFRPWIAAAVTTVVFCLGHVLYLPDRFGPSNWLAAAAMLAMGLVFAALRAKFRSLHLLIALHLGFYFVFS
ncbi:CPBP family intramembrane glutamic endopeptidase [Gulosibacter macacae]|uniref:CPBP family intramembrane glutamic endopeptidase n=1 Tax=Gulosibacter macacae TaxID=2488791 RepID=UPI00163B068B|nr:CPBP family intramembrane glutamic endopeptidase [Gulosibacter macacae]